MKRIYRISLIMLSALWLYSHPETQAQVVIGSTDSPKEFSVLELISSQGDGGLRLPQMTTIDRNAMMLQEDFVEYKKDLAKGLMIFNMDTNHPEVWNGNAWIVMNREPQVDNTDYCSIDIDDIIFETDFNVRTVLASRELVVRVKRKDGLPVKHITVDNMKDVKFITSGEIVFRPQPIQYRGYDYADGSEFGNPFETRSYSVTINNCSNLTKVLELVVVDRCHFGNHDYMCFNLGADETKNPFMPDPDIHGNRYKWGRKEPILTRENDKIVEAPENWTDITQLLAIEYNWYDLGTDPCPPGWKLAQPIKISNYSTFVTTYEAGDSEYGLYEGGLTMGSSLFFPLSGIRSYAAGVDEDKKAWLKYRGSVGRYWSHTYANGVGLVFGSDITDWEPAQSREDALPVRCIIIE